MGILTTLLTLPVGGPMRGAMWVAGQVLQAAEAELNDPAALRAALTLLEEKLDAGAITEEEFEAEEVILLDRIEALAAKAGR